MTRAFLDFSVVAVVPGHRVRIISGEQVGLIGKVLGVEDGVVKCISGPEPGTVTDIPVASMRLHLEVGDYVEVHLGGDIGKHGGVIKVERGIDQDCITFTDDMSIKSGQPQQVGF
jgi:ribosomal protein L24